MTTSSPIGAVVFALHTHLPYVRLAGRWPHGEEWIHEAASESYIPLIIMLDDLRQDGIPFRLTLSITPVLAEQLADPLVRENFDRYLDARIHAAESDYVRFEHGIGHLRYLAEWTRDYYVMIKQTYNERFGRDLLGALRRLRDAGTIELATSAATHPYLPLLTQDVSLHAQIETGIRTHERIFGERPASFWLPELGYRPAYTTEAGVVRPGLEHWLAQQGIRVTFADSHAITGGSPMGISAGDGVGPIEEIARRYVVPTTEPPTREASTFCGYYIGGPQTPHDARVAVIGRHARACQQVWSGEMGYPGDPDYREFHRYDPDSGVKYWRVTGKDIPLDQKDMYHPDWAQAKIDQHAEHYAHMLGDILRKHHRATGEAGVVLAAFDTELFGHWWFEGVRWLGQTLRYLADFPEIQLTTASDFIAHSPPTETITLPESSWGAGGANFIWDNGETHWMWDAIAASETRMNALLKLPNNDEAGRDMALAQAARELLLLQSSDWQYLITTRQARNYATQRFNQHLERFSRLADSLEAGAPDEAYAAEMYELDRLFSDIDMASFDTDRVAAGLGTDVPASATPGTTTPGTGTPEAQNGAPASSLNLPHPPETP